MKKSYILLIMLFIISVFLVACDEPSSTDTTEGGSNSETAKVSEEEQSDETSSEEPSDLKLGEAIEMGDLTFTAKSARWDDGDEFSSPEEGQRWLIIDAEITNNSDESTTISSILMFDLYDDENYSTDLAIFAETRGSLDGELGAGRATSGEIAFDVPETSQSFEFVFEPELFGFGQAIYNIDASEVQ